MGFIAGLILEIFAQLLLEIVAEFLLALGWFTVSSPFRKEKEIPVPLAAIGIVVLAGLCAWIYDYFVPASILIPPPFPGISMLISPVAIGGLTHLVGMWLQRNGRPSAHLMTFWGGALFAFVVATTRFIMLR